MTINIRFFFMLITVLTFAACDDDDDVTIDPVTFDVTIENISTPGLIDTERAMGSNPLSPPVYAHFTGEDPMFTPGELANAGTESIAEDGFPDAMVMMLAGNSDVKTSAAVTSPGGPDDGPAVFAGESISFSITAEEGDKLQFETMFVQSNDWFYTFDSGGVELFNGTTPLSGDLSDRVVVYDAGTEEDTAPGTGPTMEPGPVQKPVQDPEASNVGTAESVPVQLARERHPSFTIPDNNAVIRVTITPRS